MDGADCLCKTLSVSVFTDVPPPALTVITIVPCQGNHGPARRRPTRRELLHTQSIVVEVYRANK